MLLSTALKKVKLEVFSLCNFCRTHGPIYVIEVTQPNRDTTISKQHQLGKKGKTWVG